MQKTSNQPAECEGLVGVSRCYHESPEIPPLPRLDILSMHDIQNSTKYFSQKEGRMMKLDFYL